MSVPGNNLLASGLLLVTHLHQLNHAGGRFEVVALGRERCRKDTPAPQVVHIVAVKVVVVIIVVVIVVVIVAVHDVDDVHDSADGDGGERHKLERGYGGSRWCLWRAICKEGRRFKFRLLHGILFTNPSPGLILSHVLVDRVLLTWILSVSLSARFCLD